MTVPTPPAPLAEGRWFWRRLYVFVVTASVHGLLAFAVWRTPPWRMPEVAEGLIWLLGLLLVLYLVAPTAQQMVELLANLKLRLGRGGR